MNNSYLSVSNADLNLKQDSIGEDVEKALREREGALVLVIESLQGVRSSKEWDVLREKVFGPLSDSLLREIGAEARSESPDPLKLNRISGQLKWAERYADLGKLEEEYRSALSYVRQKLHGKN